jgi:pyruvate kinase
MFSVRRVLSAAQTSRSYIHRRIGTVGHNASLNVDLPEKQDRKTKIICTVGPSTWDPEGIQGLLERGMNVLRLNFSHGSHEDKSRVIADLRAVLGNIRKGHKVDFSDGSREDICAVAADTKGPEIRTGHFKGDDTLIRLEEGQFIDLSTDPANFDNGSSELIYCDYKELPSEVTVGQRIFIDDGLISLTVTGIKDRRTIVCIVDNGGALGQQKGVNIPEPFKSKLPGVTAQDAKDLKFAAEQGVDFIFASFIRRKEDVQDVRKALGGDGKGVKIISKIENMEGCENFDEILAESDGIMVARGDLGIEIPQHTVFLAQKMMISKCNIVGKPVICATQMLESMIDNPRPTRAESSDVANAVLDGADAIMLSGETAKGKYPFQAVEMMAKIAKEAEVAIDYDNIFRQMRGINAKFDSLKSSFPLTLETIATSAVVASLEIDAPAIVCFSYSGSMVRAIAKYRPSCPIICVTDSEKVANSVLLHRGIIPLFIPSEDMLDLQKGMSTVMDEIKNMKLFSKPYGEERHSDTGGKLVVIGRFDVSRPLAPVMTLV